MNFQLWQQEITQNLESCLNNHLPHEIMDEVIRYSVFPAGKLFRPLLVYAFATDLGEITDNHRHFACSLELHHTYTLIHDDLPAMDDDDMRRGRASSHVKFNQWKAILAGDALLNLSYKILSQIESEQLNHLINDYGDYMGPKGLILGQALDLDGKSKSLQDVIRIHELKTARLIQLAFVGSNYLLNLPLPKDQCLKLGHALGVCFQLLDDLCELCDEISTHEKEINPFLRFETQEVLSALYEESNHIHSICKDAKLTITKEYIDSYLRKMFEKVYENKTRIQEFFELDLNEFKVKLGLS